MSPPHAPCARDATNAVDGYVSESWRSGQEDREARCADRWRRNRPRRRWQRRAAPRAEESRRRGPRWMRARRRARARRVHRARKGWMTQPRRHGGDARRTCGARSLARSPPRAVPGSARGEPRAARAAGGAGGRTSRAVAAWCRGSLTGTKREGRGGEIDRHNVVTRFVGFVMRDGGLGRPMQHHGEVSTHRVARTRKGENAPVTSLDSATILDNSHGRSVRGGGQ